MPATLGRRRVGRRSQTQGDARRAEKKEVAAADSSDESADDEMPTTVNDKGDDESSNLGSYTFKELAEVGRGISHPALVSNAITMSNNIEPHKLSQKRGTYIGKDLVPFVSKVAKCPSTCAPSNTIFISVSTLANYEVLPRGHHERTKSVLLHEQIRSGYV